MSNRVNSCGSGVSINPDDYLSGSSALTGYGHSFCNMDSLHNFRNRFGGNLSWQNSGGGFPSMVDGAMKVWDYDTGFKRQYVNVPDSRTGDALARSAKTYSDIIGNIGKNSDNYMNLWDNPLGKNLEKILKASMSEMDKIVPDTKPEKPADTSGDTDEEAERTTIERKDEKAQRAALRSKGYDEETSEDIISAAKTKAEESDDPLESFKDIIETAPSNKPRDPANETPEQAKARENDVGKWMLDTFGTNTGEGVVDTVSSNYSAERTENAGRFKTDMEASLGTDGLGVAGLKITANADGSAVVITSNENDEDIFKPLPKGKQEDKSKRETALAKAKETFGKLPHGVKLYVNGQEIIQSAQTPAQQGQQSPADKGFVDLTDSLQKGALRNNELDYAGIGVGSDGDVSVFIGEKDLTLAQSRDLHKRLKAFGDRPITIGKPNNNGAGFVNGTEQTGKADEITLKQVQTFLTPSAELERFARDNNLVFAKQADDTLKLSTGKTKSLDAEKQKALIEILKKLPANTKVQIGDNTAVSITRIGTIGDLEGQVGRVFTDHGDALNKFGKGVKVTKDGDTVVISRDGEPLKGEDFDALQELIKNLPDGTKIKFAGSDKVIEKKTDNEQKIERATTQMFIPQKALNDFGHGITTAEKDGVIQITGAEKLSIKQRKELARTIEFLGKDARVKIGNGKVISAGDSDKVADDIDDSFTLSPADFEKQAVALNYPVTIYRYSIGGSTITFTKKDKGLDNAQIGKILWLAEQLPEDNEIVFKTSDGDPAPLKVNAGKITYKSFTKVKIS